MTDDEAGLRAAQQLVAAEAHQVGASSHGLLHGDLARQPPAGQVHQSATAQVHGHGQAGLVRDAGHLGLGHAAGKALHRIVAGVDLHEHGGARGDGVGVVGRMGAVGGAHLHQLGAGARHDVRDAEGTADLDQLAPRDHHLLAACQAVEHQQHAGGVVVHDGGVFGASQFAQPAAHQVVAIAAPAAVQVKFQVGGRGHGPCHGLGHLIRQQRPPQVGVQHGAGEVEDLAQARSQLTAQGLFHPGRPGLVGGGKIATDHGWLHTVGRCVPGFCCVLSTCVLSTPSVARLGQQVADDGHGAGVAIFVQQGLHARQAQQRIHRRQGRLPALTKALAGRRLSRLRRPAGCRVASRNVAPRHQWGVLWPS